MNPTPKEVEAMVMDFWMRSTLRDELVELLVDEKASGGSVLKHKPYINEALIDWSKALLLIELPLACTPNNFVLVRDLLAKDVIKRADEILNEEGYKSEN
jgi:hypothetical protein